MPVLQSFKVSWKEMCAYFSCDEVAHFAHYNYDKINFEIPTSKSNKKKMYPGTFTWDYRQFNFVPRVWIDNRSSYKINLEKLIRNNQ